MDMPKKQLVAEALIDLHRRLNTFPIRSHERRTIMQETANLYGVSEQSLYRALAQRARPRALRRSDRGTPRVLPQDLRQWGYDHETLRRQPATVRFQAEHSNDCWQFDLSPSDLKEIKEPLWLQPNKGAPTLMLFSR
jgi:hypothetical protein